MGHDPANARGPFACEVRAAGDPSSARREARVLLRCLAITLGFAAVEAATGLWSGSLALLSDAGHMLADGAGLALAFVGAKVSAGAPSRRFSYGLGRVEVVVAVANGLLLCGAVAWIAVHAVSRLRAPTPVDGLPVAVVATIGLLANVVVARMLGHQKSLNARAALLHVLGDLAGSVGAIAAGVVILLWGWLPVDPLLSLGISLLVLWSAVRVLRDGTRILLEGVPAHIDLEQVGRAMANVVGVRSVHDLHVWQVSSREVALSAHVVLGDPGDWEPTIERVRVLLRERFDIGHSTLQPARPTGTVQLEGAPPTSSAS